MDIYSIIINAAVNLGDAMTQGYSKAYYRGRVRGTSETVADILGITYSEARQLLADIIRMIRRCEKACRRDGYACPRNAAIWAVDRIADKLIAEAMPCQEACA